MENYAREDVLGRGAMGSVFLVRRRADGKRLALKTVAIAAAKDRQLALNEIAILKSLDHPHVVHFVDSFVADEELCIAMEYCAGGDLGTAARQQALQSDCRKSRYAQ